MVQSAWFQASPETVLPMSRVIWLVSVVIGLDKRLDRPVYYFSFLIDKERSRLRQGLLLSRLVQRLGDELTLRGDERRPVIRLLDHADWDQRWRA